MAISAKLVKELRERTGSGMMECKKALVETDGDIEAAVELMRKAGQAKADKKASRVAAEGTIVIEQNGNNAVMLEVNSETDFVAKGDDFMNFCHEVAKNILETKPADVEALLAANDGAIETQRRTLIAKIGENINIRRFSLFDMAGDSHLGAYSHNGRIGVLVDMKGGNPELSKDVAMHIAASKPVCINADQVPTDVINKEKEIFTAQAKESGKPDNIIEKMITGRINKFLKEITLLGQPFVKDPDQTIEKLLKANSAEVIKFENFVLGEGIEKKVDNFAEEVMKQAGA